MLLSLPPPPEMHKMILQHLLQLQRGPFSLNLKDRNAVAVVVADVVADVGLAVQVPDRVVAAVNRHLNLRALLVILNFSYHFLILCNVFNYTTI